MPIPSNYPPGVTGNEVQIVGPGEEPMIVCLDCGEAFDSLEPAYEHEADCSEITGNREGPDYRIVPAAEAM